MRQASWSAGSSISTIRAAPASWRVLYSAGLPAPPPVSALRRCPRSRYPAATNAYCLFRLGFGGAFAQPIKLYGRPGRFPPQLLVSIDVFFGIDAAIQHE